VGQFHGSMCALRRQEFALMGVAAHHSLSSTTVRSMGFNIRTVKLVQMAHTIALAKGRVIHHQGIRLVARIYRAHGWESVTLNVIRNPQ
jgi:uncharacterized membrane protein YgdD (TMEM256/DUF423 family)